MRKHTAMIQNICGITAATSKAASPMRAYTKHLDTIYATSKSMATAGRSLQSNCKKTDVQAILCTKLRPVPAERLQREQPRRKLAKARPANALLWNPKLQNSPLNLHKTSAVPR